MLYYGERDGEQMALMAAEIAAGQTRIIAQQRAPHMVGFYGLENWDNLLVTSYCRGNSS